VPDFGVRAFDWTQAGVARDRRQTGPAEIVQPFWYSSG
jgi:hypothetical protein